MSSKIGDTSVHEITKNMCYNNTKFFIDNIIRAYISIKNVYSASKWSVRSNNYKFLKRLEFSIINFTTNEVFENSSYMDGPSTYIEIPMINRILNDDDQYYIKRICSKVTSEYCMSIEHVYNDSTKIGFRPNIIVVANPYRKLSNIINEGYRSIVSDSISNTLILKLDFNSEAYYQEYNSVYNQLNKYINDYFVVMDELLYDESQ